MHLGWGGGGPNLKKPHEAFHYARPTTMHSNTYMSFSQTPCLVPICTDNDNPGKYVWAN